MTESFFFRLQSPLGLVAAALLLIAGCMESPGSRLSSLRGAETRPLETTTHLRPPRSDPG
jgi:hypothetical protein